uniref:Uncharacterized protein n=1 Tax=Ditylenchus dipsaci TaxID=166011 RepID=A0A915EFN8_9BILA
MASEWTHAASHVEFFTEYQVEFTTSRLDFFSHYFGLLWHLVTQVDFCGILATQVNLYGNLVGRRGISSGVLRHLRWTSSTSQVDFSGILGGLLRHLRWAALAIHVVGGRTSETSQWTSLETRCTSTASLVDFCTDSGRLDGHLRHLWWTSVVTLFHLGRHLRHHWWTSTDSQMDVCGISASLVDFCGDSGVSGGLLRQLKCSFTALQLTSYSVSGELTADFYAIPDGLYWTLMATQVVLTAFQQDFFTLTSTATQAVFIGNLTGLSRHFSCGLKLTSNSTQVFIYDIFFGRLCHLRRISLAFQVHVCAIFDVTTTWVGIYDNSERLLLQLRWNSLAIRVDFGGLYSGLGWTTKAAQVNSYSNSIKRIWRILATLVDSMAMQVYFCSICIYSILAMSDPSKIPEEVKKQIDDALALWVNNASVEKTPGNSMIDKSVMQSIIDVKTSNLASDGISTSGITSDGSMASKDGISASNGMIGISGVDGNNGNKGNKRKKVIARIPKGTKRQPSHISSCLHPSTPLFWTFIIPAWTLWFIVLVRNQLSITACRQSRLTADKEQLYWARKTCKGLPILLSWFLMTFFTLLFAVDMQLFWLCITYVVLVTIFGPMLFILHTHNYVNSCNGMYSLTHLSFYNPCVVKRPQSSRTTPPAPPPPPAQLLKNDVKEVVVRPTSASSPIVLNPTSTPGGNVVSLPTPIILPAVQQPVGVPSQMLTDPNTGPASAQQFYDWLTDRNVDNIEK